MIQITRNLARQIRSGFRRALNITPRGLSYPVTLQSGPNGLCIRAKSLDAAVEYHGSGSFPVEQITVPFEFLADCEGRKDEPVQLEAGTNGRIAVQWRDGSVPQIVQYDTAEPGDAAGKFPNLPEHFAQNPTSLLGAFEQAAETTDSGSVRFALGCVQMRGKHGSLAATDQRQLLVQSGFTFPWDNDILVPKAKFLPSPAFNGDQPVEVGKAGDWVAFRIGEWTVWLAINKDGRFPDVSRHIPRAADATATCRLSPADARFLAETLPRLPSDDAMNYPVTVDLNGSVAIRSKPANQDQITEIVLRNSSWSGNPVRINTNRQYLARAAKLGFQEIHLYGPESAVFCKDDHRQYVWMVLSSESAIPPSEDPLRIESPADPAGTHQPKRKKDVSKPNNVSKANNEPEAVSRNGQNHAAATAKPEQPSGAIEQAIALRDVLRDAANKANELIRTLQHDKKQARHLRTALASLREIQQLEI
jgi:hypothetical protein